MAKKKQFVTAAAAFAVAASAVAPAITADAATKTVRLKSDFVRVGNLDATLDKTYNGGEIHWYKSSVDLNKLGVFQTAKGFVKGQGIRVEKRVRVLNHAQEIKPTSEFVFEQGVPVSGIRVQPVLFADGKEYAKPVKAAGFSTEKVGEFEGTLTYSNKAYGTVTKTVKYKVVASEVEISNVSSSVDQAAEVLSVNADVKNLKDGEKVELVVYPGKDTSATPIKETATVKDGKLTVSKKLPAGTHSFQLVSGDVKTAITEFTVEAPMVKEVKAINAKKVEVKFNKAVDASTVLDSSNALRNITLSGVPTGSTPAANPGTLTGALSEDGMTLTITASATFDGKYAFVSTDSVKTKDGKKFDAYSTVIAANDTVAPTLVSAKASAKTSTNVVTLKFSEPVSSTGAIITVNGQAASIAAGSSSDELVLTTNAPLEAGKSYAISILNVKDAAGNFMASNPSTASVTVEADVAAPVVTGLSVVRDNLVEVSFDKAINASTLAGNIRLLDANGVAQGSISASIKPNTGGKTVLVPVAPTFNSAGNFNGTLIFSDSIKDTAGNALTTTSRSVSITKDTVAPTVVGNTKHIAAGESFKGRAYANGAIVLEFNEDVAYRGSLGATKLISSTGTDVTSTFLTLGASVVDDKFLVIPTASALPEGTHNLRLGASVVEDLSIAGNDNVFGIYGVTVAPVQSTDTTRPVVSPTVTPRAATNATTGSTITLRVTDNVAVDPTSLLNVNNYLLNGLPLPVGTFVTTDYSADAPTSVNVTLNIPAGGIATTADYTLNVNNLKDKAGNVIAPFVATGLALVDDKAPELTSANILSNGLLILGFSEAVDTVVGTTENDFSLRVGSVDIARSQVVFTDGAGTDAGKYVVAVTATIDEGADADAATTADNRLFIDNNGDGDYNTGDILIRTGVTGAIGTSTLNLNDLSSLQVSTVATPSVVTDSSPLNNLLKGGKVITVK